MMEPVASLACFFVAVLDSSEHYISRLEAFCLRSLCFTATILDQAGSDILSVLFTAACNIFQKFSSCFVLF